MTLDELETSVGFCLHDAILLKMDVDYLNRELHLKVRIYVHGPDDPDDQIYRAAVVTFSGLFFCVIEPPDCRIARVQSGEVVYDHGTPYLRNELRIDCGVVKDLREPPSVKLPETESAAAFTSWIFVVDWNSFIYISALNASIVWLEDVASS